MFYNRPSHSLNEPNQLVSNQFTTDSFSMVQQVYFHLGTLKYLADNIPTINTVGSEMYKLEGIQRYLGDIIAVAHTLNDIVNIQKELPVLKDLAPRITDFSTQLSDIECKLQQHKVSFEEAMGAINSNVKMLEDMYIQYECGLSRLIEEYKANLCSDYEQYKSELSLLAQSMQKQYSEFNQGINVLKEAVQTQNETKQLLEHLKTSDLVFTALLVGSEKASKEALKQIKQSEKWGNDESINRERLNYKLPKNNVFNVIKSNNERLLEEEDYA